jgi:hypothetical protein
VIIVWIPTYTVVVAIVAPHLPAILAAKWYAH